MCAVGGALAVGEFWPDLTCCRNRTAYERRLKIVMSPGPGSSFCVRRANYLKKSTVKPLLYMPIVKKQQTRNTDAKNLVLLLWTLELWELCSRLTGPGAPDLDGNAFFNTRSLFKNLTESLNNQQKKIGRLLILDELEKLGPACEPGPLSPITHWNPLAPLFKRSLLFA